MKKIKLIIVIVLASILAVVASILIVSILNTYSVNKNNAYKRENGITFTDVYGIKLFEGNDTNGKERVNDSDKVKLMDVNIHRNSEEDLKNMLKNYMDKDNILDGNYTAYDLRIDIVEEDPYAEDFEVPYLPGVYTIENIKLMAAIKQKKIQLYIKS